MTKQPGPTVAEVGMTADRTAAIQRAASRIFARAEDAPDSDCIHWTGPVSATGYAHVRVTVVRSPVGAHRVVAEWSLQRPLARDEHIDHVCHSVHPTCTGGPSCAHRRCVNPKHLEPVTPVVNSRRGWKARMPQCERGHDFDEQNTGVNSHGGRYCITCQRAKNREAGAIRRAAARAAA